MGEGVLVRGTGQGPDPGGLVVSRVRAGRPGGSDPAGHPALSSSAAAVAERVAATEERQARQVDVDVDGGLAVTSRRGPHDVDQPGVEGLPGGGRGVLGLALDRLGQPQGDARGAAVVEVLGRGRGSRRGRRCGGDRGDGRAGDGRVDDERELAAVEAYVDAAAGISAVISAQAWLMASIRARRAAGSSAKPSRSAALRSSSPAPSAAASRSRRRCST